MSAFNEPWRAEIKTNSDYVSYGTVVDASGVEITSAELVGEGCVACAAYPCVSDQHLERIVTCINFLRGVSNDDMNILLRHEKRCLELGYETDGCLINDCRDFVRKAVARNPHIAHAEEGE